MYLKNILEMQGKAPKDMFGQIGHPNLLGTRPR